LATALLIFFRLRKRDTSASSGINSTFEVLKKVQLLNLNAFRCS